MFFVPLLSVQAASAACPSGCGGTNVVVTVDESGASVAEHPSDTLPALPRSAPVATYSHGDISDFNGTVVIAGPLSLNPSDPYYSYSKVFRQSLEVFARWLHEERGGVRLGDARFGIRFHWVGDGSSQEQVTNATARALRTSGAHFAISGYSSGLTLYAAKQSYAEGLLMVSGGAASTAVFTQNNLTYGFYPPAGSYTTNSLLAIAAAAQAVDARAQTVAALPGDSRCGGGVGGCLASLRVAFVQADTVFTRAQCLSAPDNALAAGLALLETSDAEGAAMATVAREPDEEALDDALRGFQAAGANVLIGCTYYSTAKAIIASLERLDWAPLAVAVTEAVGSNPVYAAEVVDGWWQGEYVLGPTPWHPSTPARGEFSNLTSGDFYARYKEANDNAEVTYHGAANFAAAATLVDAIERAQSLETAAVAAQMDAIQLNEFYGSVSFDANHQIELPMVVTQVAEGLPRYPGQVEEVVFPPAAVSTGSTAFPMPTWASRRCRALGPVSTWSDDGAVEGATTTTRLTQECSGHGTCDDAGACVCASGWGGATCHIASESSGCAAGQTRDDSSGACVACEVGKYKSGESDEACTACGEFATTLGNGSTGISQCVCSAGYYRHDAATPVVFCEACPELALCPLDTTIASLVLRPGVWRLSNQSSELLACSGLPQCECLGHNYGVARRRGYLEPQGDDTYGSSCYSAWDAPEVHCDGWEEDATGREWCGQQWCYVTSPNCPGALPTSFFAGYANVSSALYYSYTQCGSVDYFSSDEERSSFASPCRGGGDAGNDGAGYCEPGQRGPLCEACTQDEHYYDAEQHRCTACPEQSRGGYLALFALLILGGAAAAYRLLFVAPPAALRGVAAALRRATAVVRSLGWVAKLKIGVGFLQIWYNIPHLYDVTVPEELSSWFDAFQFVALNLDDVYPAECIGKKGATNRFSKQLLLTAFLPIAVCVALAMCALLWAALERMPTRLRRTFLRRLAPRNVHPSKSLLTRAATMATPPILFVVFCVVPSVSRALFETWACRRFRYRDDDSSLDHFYLKSVNGLRCGSDEHDHITSTASGLLALWPTAAVALFAALLLTARGAITSGPPTELSAAIGVLHREYKTETFWWELVELGRRLMLNGLLIAAVDEDHASLRLVLANFIALGYLSLLMSAAPYRRDDDNALASFGALALCASLLSAFFIKIAGELDDARALLGTNSTYGFALMMLAVVLTLLGTSVAAMAWRSYTMQRRAQAARKAVQAQKEMQGRMANPPTTRWVTERTYCTFLSHFKAEAGSDARYMRDLLQSMCHCPVFLDSANLADLRLLFSEGLHKSDTMIVLATRDYLTRPFCLLELWEAHRQGIPVLVVPVMGRGYDEAQARRTLGALDTELSVSDPPTYKLIMTHLKKQGVHDIAVMKRALLRLMRLEVGWKQLQGETSNRHVGAPVAPSAQETDIATPASEAGGGMAGTAADGIEPPQEPPGIASAEQESAALLDEDSSATLEWCPWGSDNQILSTAEALINRIGVMTGRQLVWREAGAESSAAAAHGRTDSFSVSTSKGSTMSVGLGQIVTSATVAAKASKVAFTEPTKHAPPAGLDESERLDDLSARRRGRMQRLLGSARSFRRARHARSFSKPACRSKGLLVLCDHSSPKATGAARLIEGQLRAHLCEKWRVILGAGDPLTLSLELEDVDVVLLLQTSRVLERATVLLQTFEALNDQMPVLCVLLRQSSYDFTRAKEHLGRLALKLPGAELDSLQRLLQERDLTLARLTTTLRSSLPNIISISFDANGTDSESRVFLRDVTDRLTQLTQRSSSLSNFALGVLEEHIHQTQLMIRGVGAIREVHEEAVQKRSPSPITTLLSKASVAGSSIRRSLPHAVVRLPKRGYP